MLDQASIMPAGLQPETQPDNPPVDLEAQGHWLAEDHRRHARVSPGVRNGSSDAEPFGALELDETWDSFRNEQAWLSTVRS